MVPKTDIKVALVDDEECYRKNLIRAFERSDAFRVVHESASSAGICGALMDSAPDVLLLDHTGSRSDGLRVLQEIRANPKTRGQTVAVLSAHGDAAHISAAIGTGRADAYITKDESPERIVSYVRLLKEGGRLLLAVGRGVDLDNGEEPDFRGVKGLTNGQLQIADLLNEGLKPAVISGRTGVSIATVYRHIHNIKKAIGFREYDGVLLFDAYLRKYLDLCRGVRA